MSGTTTAAWELFKGALQEPKLQADYRVRLKFGTIEFDRCELAVRAYHGALYNFLSEHCFPHPSPDQLIDRVNAKLKTKNLDKGLQSLLRQYLKYEEEMRWFDSRSFANDVFAWMIIPPQAHT